MSSDDPGCRDIAPEKSALHREKFRHMNPSARLCVGVLLEKYPVLALVFNAERISPEMPLRGLNPADPARSESASKSGFAPCRMPIRQWSTAFFRNGYLSAFFQRTGPSQRIMSELVGLR